MVIKTVQEYFSDGCGGCPLFATPDCRVHTWEKEIAQLRKIVLACGLTEELKWRHPCYSNQKSNILLLSTAKDYCMLSFFKGVLLQDAQRLLVAQTENMQADRQMRFTSMANVLDREATIKAYIFEAIEIEKAGLKVPYKKASEFIVPDEFQQKLDDIPVLKKAFEALTPGRQRGYLLHFAAAKQSKTREARVEKYIQKILDGKGLED